MTRLWSDKKIINFDFTHYCCQLCQERCQCFFNIFLVATAHWFSDRSDNWLLSHNWTFLEQNIKYRKAGFFKTIHHTVNLAISCSSVYYSMLPKANISSSRKTELTSVFIVANILLKRTRFLVLSYYVEGRRFC